MVAPNPKHCDAYTPGHDVHPIQARKSWEAGAGQAARIVSVDDDGTITFADGSTRWNHDPARLRGLLARHGSDVSLGAYGVMKLGHDDGRLVDDERFVVDLHYCFCVGPGPTPCPGPAQPPESLEELVRQAVERGGVLISGREVLRLVEQRRGNVIQPGHTANAQAGLGRRNVCVTDEVGVLAGFAPEEEAEER